MATWKIDGEKSNFGSKKCLVGVIRGKINWCKPTNHSLLVKIQCLWDIKGGKP